MMTKPMSLYEAFCEAIRKLFRKPDSKPDAPEPQRIPLGPQHAIYDFASEERRDSRYAKEMVKYDAARQCLIATTGAIAISVPAPGNVSCDVLIKARALKAAFAQGGACALKWADGEVSIVGCRDEVRGSSSMQDVRYPDVAAFMGNRPARNLVFKLDPKLLKILVDYAVAQGCVGIAFSTKTTLGDDGVAVVDREIRFQVDDIATGLIAPIAWVPDEKK